MIDRMQESHRLAEPIQILTTNFFASWYSQRLSCKATSRFITNPSTMHSPATAPPLGRLLLQKQWHCLQRRLSRFDFPLHQRYHAPVPSPFLFAYPYSLLQSGQRSCAGVPRLSTPHHAPKTAILRGGSSLATPNRSLTLTTSSQGMRGGDTRWRLWAPIVCPISNKAAPEPGVGVALPCRVDPAAAPLI